MATGSQRASGLSRWLPTLLGGVLALGVAFAYELEWLGDDGDCPPASTLAPAPTPDSSARLAPRPLPRHAPPAAEALDAELLQARVAALELQAKLMAERSVTGELAYYGHSQAELEAMARHCDLRVDYPKALDPRESEDLGLDASERAAWQQALEAFAREEQATYRALLAELDPQLEGLDQLPLAQLRRQLIRRVPGSEAPGDASLQRHVALERAGQRDAPADPSSLSVFNRYHRFRLSAGDRFAAHMSAQLGSPRAKELRAAFSGWPGARTRQLGCPDEALSPAAEP